MSIAAIGRKIDMIVYTDNKGNMRPIRFRVENHEGARVVIKIKSAMVKEVQAFGQNKTIRYACHSIINGILQSYEITYETRTMKWLLYANSSQL